jgi:PAS domain S-box-containing protein
MAEAFANARTQPGLEVASAVTDDDGGVPAAAGPVMAEIGLAMPSTPPLALGARQIPELDIVVTLSEEAARACPMLPGNPLRVDWKLPTPHAVAGDAATVADYLRQSRETLRRLVSDLFDRGYFEALSSAHDASDSLLDHVSDGILAHDRRRRIFVFNSAAARITEFSRADVLNRDCHDVFPGNLCGTRCDFCEGGTLPTEIVRREMRIATRTGETRVVDATLRPLRDAAGEVSGAMVTFHDITQERHLARQVGEIRQFAGIVGRDIKMLEVFDLIRDLADSNVPVLVRGESGTGKELIAAAIHNEGPRANRLFVPVNCGALPEALLESELFGHVKGAFTGAIRDKKGRFELADGGTIFLDEIGDISPAMQVKLLRVLQEGSFERVGGEQTLRVNVRVISATNKNIEEEIREGRFREDLYYRLNVVPVFLPALRERRNDIPLLAEHILARALQEVGRAGVRLAPETLDAMMNYGWPGNVRELQNWIQFALVKCRGDAIRPEHLPPALHAPAQMMPVPGARQRRLEADGVRVALRESGGNKVAAAKLLGVSRATLYRFLDEEAARSRGEAPAAGRAGSP